MYHYFNQICEFRKNNPGIRGYGLKVTDPLLDSTKLALEKLKLSIEAELSGYKDISYQYKVSKGQGYFPSILHVSILPPGQSVSKGIYVVICFDINGNGALVGCAESKTYPQGLNTVTRSKTNLLINVDGLRETTKYNDVFENPKEFLYPLRTSDELVQHLKRSLDLCLYHLTLSDSSDLPIREIVNAKYEYDFSPENIVDARERISTHIAKRRGQKRFREKLLSAYKGKCAITKCETVDVLEAAHILPYKGPETNHIQNGIILRSDIHVLFDLGLLSIDCETLCVKVSRKLFGTEYENYSGIRIILPDNIFEHPSILSLEYHMNIVFSDL